MRPVCYSVAMSLDGLIAGPNGEADWIVMDPEIDFGQLFARFDTLLMGRKSWEAAKSQGGGGMPGMGLPGMLGNGGGSDEPAPSRTKKKKRHKKRK